MPHNDPNGRIPVDPTLLEAIRALSREGPRPVAQDATAVDVGMPTSAFPYDRSYSTPGRMLKGHGRTVSPEDIEGIAERLQRTWWKSSDNAFLDQVQQLKKEGARRVASEGVPGLESLPPRTEVVERPGAGPDAAYGRMLYERLPQLIESPLFTDTLAPLTGVTPDTVYGHGRYEAAMRGNRYVGEVLANTPASPRRNIINFYLGGLEEPDSALQNTMTHEMAHRSDLYGGKHEQLRREFDRRTGVNPGNPEPFAMAFAEATDILRRAGSQQEALEAAGRREDVRPGTRLLTERLMSDPVFRERFGRPRPASIIERFLMRPNGDR